VASVASPNYRAMPPPGHDLVELVTVERPEHRQRLLQAQLARRVRDDADMLRLRIEEMSKERPKTWSRFRELLRSLPAWALGYHDDVGPGAATATGAVRPRCH